MQNATNINLDALVQQVHVLYPHLPSNDGQADIDLRRKLNEQLICKIPQVELEHLDLNCIIMNVKKSLSEFQRRIDESVAQQQLRRTTRVRKTIQQDPAVVNFFNCGIKSDRKNFLSTTVKADTAPTCANSKCCHQISELSALVQVESLPVSASTNLLTIFVPSILQEKLHSCKYKISIDLNRLDLTKKILDLNVGQHVNCNIETDTKEEPVKAIENIADRTDQDDQERKVTHDIKEDLESHNTADETQTTNSVENKVEVKPSPDTANSPKSLEPIVSIDVNKTPTPRPVGNKRGPKRRTPKPPSNDPPKKRGRKLGSKNKKKDEKSELAKYVEMFECNAGSPSAVSQIVTSTTQNWDILPEQSGQIAYFMNGEWTLSAPSNDGRQFVSTTNCAVNLEEGTGGGQETFIPFEDFVNFIENPSLDAENNVIARVLDGAVDTAQCSESDVLSLCVDNPQTVKGVDNIDTSQQNPLTSKIVNGKTEASNNGNGINIVHSTAGNNRKISTNNGVLDLSKENNTTLNADVLDLTQKKADNTTSSPGKVAERTVIFSTTRSMPSLDDMEVDLFCSTPQRGDNLEKKVVFSIAPNTSPASNHNSLHSVAEDSITDSAIEVERKDTSRDSSFAVANCSKSTPTPLKDKTKPEVIKGMSLLEIEKDIDDSLLDFDNCMDDDLLSLAPSSCFNSPTEDRFAGSNFLDVDESNVKLSAYINSSNNSSASVPRSHLELNFSKPKEQELNLALKSFKIPRLKATDETSRDLSSAKISINKAPKSHIENAPNPTVSSAYPGNGPKPLISGVHSSFTIDSSVTANSSSQIVSTREISKMFGSLCYGFLADQCFDRNCKFSHQLLELSVIITSLSFLRNEVLHLAYRFIWRHHKLFKFYFPIFCEEYARRNIRTKLSNMITDCEMQPNCLPYLRNIYLALIGTGLNRINACRFVLSRVKEKSHLTIDILLEIIIESGAAMFSTTIEQFSQVDGYKFRMKHINDLAAACLRSGNADLITVLIKCLISVDQTEFVAMRSPELIELLEMIKNGDIDGL